MNIAICYDLETTGVDPCDDKIIQIAMIKFQLNPFLFIEKKVSYINPEKPIPEEATKVHGITNEIVKDSFTFKQIALQLHRYIDDCDFLLTHNGKKFDRQMLHQEFANCNIDWIPKPMIDTYVIMSNFIPRTLEGAYKYYCEGASIENAHDAQGDILSTIKVLFGQIKMYDLDLSDDLAETLVKVSSYENEDKNLTYDGRIKLNENNIPVWNFGKYKDKYITETDLGYLNWFFMGNFPIQTKNVLRSLINR